MKIRRIAALLMAAALAATLLGGCKKTINSDFRAEMPTGPEEAEITQCFGRREERGQIL